MNSLKCPRSTSLSHSPSQSAPTILKNWAPCFLKIRHPAFWKKQSAKNQGHCNSKREEAAWSLLFLNKEWPCIFQPAFFKKQGAPFFKRQDAPFLRIVGADWLGDCLTELFPIYQDKHWTIRQWDNHSIDP